jgi:glutamyl-tRNA reductase
VHLVIVGLNHKTAPVELRERLAFPEGNLPEALTVLRMCGCVSECCILSTCNRTEVYAILDSRENEQVIVDFIASYHKIEHEKFVPHLYTYSGRHAVNHLFTVSAGLDSMMLGEAQILGQVKTAFCVAGDSECCGTVLNTLLRQSITVGKRARTETEIGKGAFSIGYAAVELAKLIFGSLTAKKILILGAGKMSELTAKHLLANGVTSVIVSNRTKAHADELAEKLGGPIPRE